MVENMIILLLTATEFMWCWLGYLPRYFVCIHSLRMHHHLAQLVGFLWFDVRRCGELSAVTKSVGAQLSALKHPKVLRTLRIFLWGIVKLPINIGRPLSPFIYYVSILFVFMIKDTAIKRTFNKFCEKSQISQQNMLNHPRTTWIFLIRVLRRSYIGCHHSYADALWFVTSKLLSSSALTSQPSPILFLWLILVQTSSHCNE